MKRYRLLTVTLVLALLGAGAAFSQDWAGRGRLQGKVTDPDGNPIQGAKVILTRGGVDGEGPEPLETNKKGRWSILGLAGGDWAAVIEADGFIPGQGSVRVNEFGSVPSIDVKLRPIPKEAIEQAAAESAVGRIDEGNKLLESGDYAGARAAYEEAMTQLDEEHHAGLLRGIARTHFQEGNVDKAVATLDQALAFDANDTDSLRLIINLLVASDREADAEPYIARLPEGATVDSNTLLNIGIKAYNDNDLDAAVANFDRVVAENPDLPDAYYYRGLCRMNQGNEAEALADFQKMLELDPEHANAGEAQEFAKYLAEQVEQE